MFSIPYLLIIFRIQISIEYCQQKRKTVVGDENGTVYDDDDFSNSLSSHSSYENERQSWG
jgi:hypothetical protein